MNVKDNGIRASFQATEWEKTMAKMRMTTATTTNMMVRTHTKKREDTRDRSTLRQKRCKFLITCHVQWQNLCRVYIWRTHSSLLNEVLLFDLSTKAERKKKRETERATSITNYCHGVHDFMLRLFCSWFNFELILSVSALAKAYAMLHILWWDCVLVAREWQEIVTHSDDSENESAWMFQRHCLCTKRTYPKIPSVRR